MSKLVTLRDSVTVKSKNYFHATGFFRILQNEKKKILVNQFKQATCCRRGGSINFKHGNPKIDGNRVNKSSLTYRVE